MAITTRETTHSRWMILGSCILVSALPGKSRAAEHPEAAVNPSEPTSAAGAPQTGAPADGTNPEAAEARVGDAEQPAPIPQVQPTTPDPAVVTQAATARVPAATSATEYPAALSIGEGGGVRVSGLLQIWALYQHQQSIDPPEDNASTLRLRRAEVKVSGELVPKKFSFGVMIDAAKVPSFGNATVVTPPGAGSTQTGTTSVLTPARDNSILQDIYVTYQSRWFDVSAGQFKTPIAYESTVSSGKLLLPERAAVVRAYGEQREMGVKVEKRFAYFGYALGAFNGSGINRTDDNMQKDIALRLEAYPFKGVVLGAVGYSSVGQRNSEGATKDRIEGDLVLQLGDLLVQGEYIHAWTGPTGARVEGAGWYGALAYTIAKTVQPVVRIGQLNRDLHEARNAATTTEGGLNWFIVKDSVKLQIAYAHTGFQASGAGALDEATLASQFKF